MAVTHVLIVEPDPVRARSYAENIGSQYKEAFVQRIGDLAKAKLLLVANKKITHISVGSEFMSRERFMGEETPVAQTDIE